MNDVEPPPAGRDRAGGPPAPAARYRFGEVVVDTSRQVVRVAGTEVTCQPRVFQLLQLLCEAGGAVVGREEIFARLWPGQSFPSDESLTQVVHRLRATLGTAGPLVHTVRGVGFRLDGPVQREDGRDPGEATAAAPARTGTVRPGTRRWRRYAPAAALVVLAAAAAAAWLGVNRPWQVIDAGYDLRRSDLAPGHRQTIDLVTRALAAERTEDRAQARHLLEIAYATDPSTPVPAIFRCLFSFWQDQPQEAAAWARRAAARLRPDSSPYLHLLVRYAAATATGRGTDWLAAASALLTLRPSAWYLRLARAHYHLAERQEAAALADLRQIPIPALNAYSQALVLADRASLGDVAGAERALAAGHLRGQEALLWYVRGRIAWSRGRPREAVAAFDREAEVAVRRNQPDLMADAQLLAGVAACQAGDLSGGASRLDQAAAAAGDRHQPDVATAALGLGAYLAWRRGDLAGRDRRLAEAARVRADPDLAYQLGLTLLALWTGAPPPQEPRALAATLPDEPELTGVRPLLLARQAWRAGDLDQARRLLRQSHLEGIDRTYFLEEAALLAADLGGGPGAPPPPAPPRVDPPYPILLRFAAVSELNRRRDAGAARQ